MTNKNNNKNEKNGNDDNQDKDKKKKEDLYSILEVSKYADKKEIKSAYRRLAKQYHPDANTEQGSTEKFQEINRAYEVLNDPNKKGRYDKWGDKGLDDSFTPPADVRNKSPFRTTRASGASTGFGGGSTATNAADFFRRSGFGGVGSGNPAQRANPGDFFGSGDFFGKSDFFGTMDWSNIYDGSSAGGSSSSSYNYNNYGNGTTTTSSGVGVGGINVGDFFNSPFGGAGYVGHKGSVKGRGQVVGNDLMFDMEIDLKTAMFGGEKEIRIRYLDTCDTCAGTGARPGATDCPHCNGTGLTVQALDSPLGISHSQQPCPKCQGTGLTEGINGCCGKCSGQGLSSRSKVIKVTIPSNVKDGNKLRLKGEGDAGLNGAAAGDLYIYMKVVKQDAASEPKPRHNNNNDATSNHHHHHNGAKQQQTTTSGRNDGYFRTGNFDFRTNGFDFSQTAANNNNNNHNSDKNGQEAPPPGQKTKNWQAKEDFFRKQYGGVGRRQPNVNGGGPATNNDGNTNTNDYSKQEFFKNNGQEFGSFSTSNPNNNNGFSNPNNNNGFNGHTTQPNNNGHTTQPNNNGHTTQPNNGYSPNNGYASNTATQRNGYSTNTPRNGYSQRNGYSTNTPRNGYSPRNGYAANTAQRNGYAANTAPPRNNGRARPPGFGSFSTKADSAANGARAPYTGFSNGRPPYTRNNNNNGRPPYSTTNTATRNSNSHASAWKSRSKTDFFKAVDAPPFDPSFWEKANKNSNSGASSNSRSKYKTKQGVEPFYGGEEQVFGGRGVAGPREIVVGDDLTFHLEVDAKTALQGGEVKVGFHHLEACGACGGRGGEVDKKTGQVFRTCPACHGQGRLRALKHIRILVPPNVQDGNKLYVRGEGNAGPNGGPAGDLYVYLKIKV